MKIKLLVVAFLITVFSWGQVSITATATAYTQNFNTLATSGTTNTWTDNTTIGGWYTNRTAYVANDGTSVTGGLHSYGTGTASERSLGALTSGGAPTVYIGGRYLNSTGSSVSSFDISYVGEQWRQTANAQSLTFEYQVGATAITGGTWTAVTALDFTALKTGTAGALDGNAAGNFSNKSATITVTVSNGQEIWFRWTKTGSTSPGLAIDDFSVTANSSCAIPANPTGTISGTTSACSSTVLSYSAPSATIYWQTSASGTSTANPTTSTYTVSSSGTYYVRSYTAPSCWSTGAVASSAITITSNPSITTQPTNASVMATSNTSFSVTASNAGSYQWQESTNGGGTYTNVTNGGVYSGATSATLTITGATLAMNGYKYICIINAISPCTTPVTTNSGVGVTLTVTPLVSSLSDIIENTAFTYTSNIDYLLYQSATITNTTTSVGTFQFTIRDGGASLSDADTNGTELTSISFNVTNSANIRSAALFLGNTLINNSPTIGVGTISFSGLSGANVTADDNTSKNLTLRISFLTAVTDNQQLQFTIASVTANSSGSQFAAANAGGAASSIIADRNRIEVSADRLAFVVQPTSVGVSGTMTPSPTVSANDINGNRDLDFTTAVSVTSTGTLTGSPVSGTVTAGLATFSGLVHTVAQTGRELTATTSGLGFSNTINSVLFDVTNVANGTYRTLTAGTWPSSGTATWERLVAGTWTSATPAAGATDLLIIRHTITTNAAFAATGGTKMKIENAGTFNAGHNCTFGSLIVESGGKFSINAPGATISATGTVTVESGGTVTANSATLNMIDGFWDGTENFKSGSTFELLNWDWTDTAANSRLITSGGSITPNANGYYFGNILFSGTPTASFTFVGLIGTQKLCENNLTINNASGSFNAILANVSANVEVAGDVIINTNKFSFGALTASNVIHTIKGNIIGNGGIIDLNQTSSGSASVTVNLEGNLTTTSTCALNSTDAGCKIVFNKSGLQTVSVAGSMGTNVAFEVAGTSTTRLINQNLALSNASNKFTVLDAGILEFNGFDITGSGDFIHLLGGTLRITSADGVNASPSATGNVKVTGTRTFSQTGVYHYVGNSSPQGTGTAMTSGSTSKRIIVDKTNATDIVNLTQSTGTTNELYITEGIFVETEASNILGSGNLTMDTGGTYKTAVTSAITPRLTGTYALNGTSTIELNAAGDQVLRGTKDYRNLTFSISGTKTISSTINTIIGTITVANAAIVDVEDKTMGGIGTYLTMTGTSEYKTAGIGVKPDAAETYNLGAGTKVTFTSGSVLVPIATLEQIRLAPNYYNIDVVGNNVGTNTLASPIKIQAGGTFTVKSTGTFKHSNTAGFHGSNVTAIDNTNSPTITLEADSTINYAGADQSITLFSPYYRNLTVSGTGTKTLKVGSGTRIQEELNVTASKLFVNVNEDITVKEGVIIASSGAEFEIKNNGQLIQIDEADTNSGTAFKIERIASVNRNDYVYWSPPTSGFNISNILSNGNRYIWNTVRVNANGTQGTWVPASNEVGAPTMTRGKGYAIAVPNSSPTRPSAAASMITTFAGKPNNGQFTFPIYRGNYSGADYDADPTVVNADTTKYDDNWNLVGNPYPSAISAERFLTVNASNVGSNNVAISGTVWIWKHGQAPTSATNPFYNNFVSNYYSTDYIKYNKLGATDTNFSGYIASGQGFMVNMKEGTGTLSSSGTTTNLDVYSGSITFNNTMRGVATTYAAQNNTDFYKTNTSDLGPVEEKHRIWLDIINNLSGQTDTSLLGYASDATLEEDNLYDAIFVPRGEVNIYSLINSNPFIIQGRPLPFDRNDVVPMGVNIVSAGSHTIAIRKVDGLFENGVTVYLEDKLLNIIHDLKQAPYMFTSDKGIFNNRFVVRYTNSALGNPDFENLDRSVVVTANHGDMVISSSIETIQDVTVYDVLGRQLYEVKNINNNNFMGSNISMSQQALIVKIKLNNGVIVTRKTVL